jgi:hypothetical protein
MDACESRTELGDCRVKSNGFGATRASILGGSVSYEGAYVLTMHRTETLAAAQLSARIHAVIQKGRIPAAWEWNGYV